MFELRTLGELTLRGADGTVLSTRRTELALLVYVVRHAHVAQTRAELAELLWPHRDARRARHSLRQALVHLRHLLGDDVVASGDPVRIRIEAVELDLTTFEADIAAGR
jgi:DNA-binding SARP family transcriptional activator